MRGVFQAPIPAHGNNSGELVKQPVELLKVAVLPFECRKISVSSLQELFMFIGVGEDILSRFIAAHVVLVEKPDFRLVRMFLVFVNHQTGNDMPGFMQTPLLSCRFIVPGEALVKFCVAVGCFFYNLTWRGFGAD